jgi:hypothetical protein
MSVQNKNSEVEIRTEIQNLLHEMLPWSCECKRKRKYGSFHGGSSRKKGVESKSRPVSVPVTNVLDLLLILMLLAAADMFALRVVETLFP